jgi:hypothetical protein
MKIFYGVQGTGNGHITRARVMAKELMPPALTLPFNLPVALSISILIWKFLTATNHAPA